MVFEGLSRPKAAEKAGIADHTLYLAMRKPSVLAYMNSQQGVLRTSAAARSIARIDILADDSTSDHVKLNANQFLLGIEGVSVTQRSESVNVHKHLMPGLTIMLGAPHAPAHDAHLIDGQAHEVREPVHINRIGEPVPHPSMRNALPAPTQEADSPGNSVPAKTRGRGEKSRARSGPG